MKNLIKLTREETILISAFLDNYISQTDDSNNVKSYATNLKNRLDKDLSNCRKK